MDYIKYFKGEQKKLVFDRLSKIDDIDELNSVLKNLTTILNNIGFTEPEKLQFTKDYNSYILENVI